MSFHLEIDYGDVSNTTKTVTPQSASLNASYGLTTTWTLAIIIRLTTVSLLMLLTLLGNAIVIITIVSCAELRYVVGGAFPTLLLTALSIDRYQVKSYNQ